MTNDKNLPGHDSPTPGERPTERPGLAWAGWIILAVTLGLCLLAVVLMHLSTRKELSTCRENRESLGRLVAQKQAVADSIKWSGRLALQTTKTDSLSNENSRLRERIALDSCARLSDLELMRSINQRYRRH